MTVDERMQDTQELLAKLTDARIELAAYIQLRRAKGYMAVSENDRLRDSFFALAKELREKGALLGHTPEHDTRGALLRAEGALSSAAVCLMSGRHDCPSYIAVNPEKLERSLNTLSYCLQYLGEHLPLEEA